MCSRQRVARVVEEMRSSMLPRWCFWFFVEVFIPCREQILHVNAGICVVDVTLQDIKISKYFKNNRGREARLVNLWEFSSNAVDERNGYRIRNGNFVRRYPDDGAILCM